MSKIIKCKICNADIASSAKSCPSCGAKNKKPFYTKVWFWIIVIIIIVFASAGGNTSSSLSQESTAESSNVSDIENNAKEEKKSDLELIGDVTNESDQFATYLSGVVQNNTNKEYSYVQITFNLYDEEGNLVGTAIDNVNNLKAGGTWKFKAMGMGESGTPTSYELAEITGF